MCSKLPRHGLAAEDYVLRDILRNQETGFLAGRPSFLHHAIFIEFPLFQDNSSFTFAWKNAVIAKQGIFYRKDNLNSLVELFYLKCKHFMQAERD